MASYPSGINLLKFFTVSTLILSAGVCFADTVTVSIRAIKAERSEGSSLDREVVASSELADIKDKLRRLRYDSLTLIADQKKEVVINEKDSLELAEGHTVYFRPVYKSDQKVCLWLKWRDSTGLNVLDTRLHFDGRETVLTGMSNDDGSGIVLAIDVK